MALLPSSSGEPLAAPVVLVEDGRGALSPLTDLRPAFAVRTGVFSLFERLTAMGATIAGVVVPDSLAAVARELVAVPVNDVSGVGDALLINARCVLVPPEASGLQPGEALAEAGSNDLIAARVDVSNVAALAERLMTGDVTSALPVRTFRELPAPALLSRPWHVRTFRDRAMAFDMQFAPARHQFAPPASITGGTPAPRSFTAFGAQPLYIHPTAHLCPACVLDLEHGPIWIDAGATIRPGATVLGPAYIGPNSTIIDHALIKAHTSIGPSCKIGGEVGGTIFQGYANKAHEGHLGDSWVGAWANLGAGTTNSNLLNTYGEVIAYATPGGSAERTGEQFLGSIIGDHARLAILSRLMTGALVGTGVMWAASKPITGHIPPFAWVTDAGERTYRTDKFMEVARTVKARRGLTLSAAEEELLRALASGS